MTDIGKNIKAAREKLNLSQTDLGDLCGWDNSPQGRVSHYENSRRSPTLTDLNDLAIALKTNVIALIGYSNFDTAVKTVLTDKTVNEIVKIIASWPDTTNTKLLLQINKLSGKQELETIANINTAKKKA